MTRSFKSRLSTIKKTHSYRVEKTKHEFVRGLTRLLKLKGISNSELAQRMETSNAYITKALRGDSNFTIDSMVKLAHAAGANLHIHVADINASVRWLEAHAGGSTFADSREKAKPDSAIASMNDIRDAFHEARSVYA